MGYNDYDSVAQRWVARALGDSRDGLRNPRLLDRGDSIFSYGSHFEVGRILRDRKGQPTGWLLNGNTYGQTTTKHQGAVRGAVDDGHGLPVVTIPHAALEAAAIDMRTVQAVDVQADWNTETVITKPSDSTWHWEYDYSTDDTDKGGWINSLTGEFVARTAYWGEGSKRPAVECEHEITVPGPWKPGYNYHHSSRLDDAREAHMRARHGVWEEVPAHRRKLGRKHAVSGNLVWDLVADDEDPRGFVLERVAHRHWLGASLIRAQVVYRARIRHQECGGTGVADEPWYTRVHPAHGQFVSGPLTREQMDGEQLRNSLLMERNGGIRQPFDWGWKLDAYIEHRECRGCGGSGRVTDLRRRWAYFLSGFDENETRPSYFFCELPPKARPATVEEAYETLKPAAVKLAEQAGREVKRQGDIFAIPMPGVTLRELKKRGGVHIRRPKLVDIDGRTTWDGPRPNLLGTNHEATEIVRVGEQTWARGTLTHAPESRRPDHRRVKLGRDWHIIQKNTVPVTA